MVEETTGDPLGDVYVLNNDPKADAAGVMAMAEKGLIRLASGTPGVDDPKGLLVRLHEAAHILQFKKDGKGRSGGASVGALEREAAGVAKAAMEGARQSVEQSALPGFMLNFTELTDELQQTWDQSKEEATAPMTALAKELPAELGTDPDALEVEADGAGLEGQGVEVEEVPEDDVVGADDRLLQEADAQTDADIDAAAKERPVNVPPEAKGSVKGQGEPDADINGEKKGEPGKDKQELDKAKLEIEQAIAKTFGKTLPVDAGTAPEVDVDMAPAQESRQRFEGQTETELAKGQGLTQEDFGEKRLEPTVDPFEGIDPELDGVEVPEVKVEEMIDQAKVDKVMKDDNVGAALSEVIVVEPDKLDAFLAGPEANEPEKKRQEILTQREDSQKEILDTRRESTTERQRLIDDATTQIDAQRERWKADQERLIGKKRTEADQLIDAQTTKANDRKRKAEVEADKVLREAEEKAKDKQDRARQKAQEKKTEAEGGSWLSRGWAWIKSKVGVVKEAITNLFKEARKAVQALLKSAKEAAFRSIDDAKTYIKACLRFIDQNLDNIIALLPDALAEIAKEHKAEIRDFLGRAQKALDYWAEQLKQGLSRLMDALESALTGLLATISGAIEVAMEGLEALMEGDLMGWLQKRFPKVAELLEKGLDGVVEDLGKSFGDWLEGMIEGLGLEKATEAFGSLMEETDGGHTVLEGAMDGCCECFKKVLDACMQAFEGMLNSPMGQKFKGFMEGFNQATDKVGVEVLTGVFEVLKTVGGPVYDFVMAASEMASQAMDALGKLGQTMWKHVATALGIDPNLSPLEAIKKGLQSLWDAVSEAVKPLMDAIKGAWDWIKNESVLAPLFDLMAQVPRIVQSLKALWKAIMADPGAWLASAAEELKNTIMGPVLEGMQLASKVAAMASAALNKWVSGLMEKLGLLGAWQSAYGFLQSVVSAVQTTVQEVKKGLGELRDKVGKTFDDLANGAKELYAYLKPLLDFVAGLAVALVGTSSGNLMAIPSFLMGNLWRHVLPECYKEPLIDFMLDVFIKLMDWYPMPPDLDFLGNGVRGAIKGFLEGLKGASEQDKVGAMDTIAKVMGGDLDFVAGLAVGLGKGIYESTIGTLVFLFDAAAWLLKMGLKLAVMPLKLAVGAFTAEDAARDDETASLTDVVERGGADGDDGVDGQEFEEEEEVESEVSLGEDLVEGETPLEDEDWDASGGGEEIEEEGGGEEEEGLELDGVEPQLGGGPVPTAPSGVSAGGVGQSAGKGGRGEVTIDAPPKMPEGLDSGKAIFDKIFKEGVSREEVEAFLKSLGGGAEQMGGELGKAGAGKLLEALNAKGTTYQIGETVGLVMGILVTEIVLLVVQLVLAPVTGGGTGATALAKLGAVGAKLLGKLGKMLPKMAKALAPLMKVFGKLKGAFGKWVNKVRKYLDELVAWAKSGLEKLRGKGKGPKTRPKAPQTAPKPRPNASKPSSPDTPQRQPARQPSPDGTGTKGQGKTPERSAGSGNGAGNGAVDNARTGAPSNGGRTGNPGTGNAGKSAVPDRPSRPGPTAARTPAGKGGAKSAKGADEVADARAVKPTPKSRKPPKARRRGKGGSARQVALAAARKGWRKARQMTSSKVVTEEALKSQLRSVRVMARPGSVKLSLVRRRSTWKVAAKATKGGKTVTVKAGKGWIAKDEKGRRWYAATSLVKFNEELVHKIEKNLNKHVKSKTTGVLSQKYRSLLKEAKAEKEKANNVVASKLTGVGVYHRIEGFGKVERDKKIHSEFTVSPNMRRYEFDINTHHDDDTDFDPVVERLKALIHNQAWPTEVVKAYCVKAARDCSDGDVVYTAEVNQVRDLGEGPRGAVNHRDEGELDHYFIFDVKLSYIDKTMEGPRSRDAKFDIKVVPQGYNEAEQTIVKQENVCAACGRTLGEHEVKSKPHSQIAASQWVKAISMAADGLDVYKFSSKSLFVARMHSLVESTNNGSYAYQRVNGRQTRVRTSDPAPAHTIDEQCSECEPLQGSHSHAQRNEISQDPKARKIWAVQLGNFLDSPEMIRRNLRRGVGEKYGATSEKPRSFSHLSRDDAKDVIGIMDDAQIHAVLKALSGLIKVTSSQRMSGATRRGDGSIVQDAKIVSKNTKTFLRLVEKFVREIASADRV